jgi:hypothetical protein
MLCLVAAPAALGQGAAAMRSVDVMKYTKDTMQHQFTDARINNLVDTLKSLNVDCIAIAIPMDASGDYPASAKPAPRDAYVLTQAWADAIHGKGLHILWRGTWSGIEGINGFPRRVGAHRLPAGTAASAATDGAATWLGKTYHYIVDHPAFFADGDLWAPLPERTEGIFQDATSFLPHDGPGIQANYLAFFTDLKKVSDAAFAKIGKRVVTGYSANNYSEVVSGWLPRDFFEAAGITSIDYYGRDHSPQELERDLRAMYSATGKPIFLQEWADYWNSQLAPRERKAYLHQIYSALGRLHRQGMLVGFNYWGGWDNTTESVVQEDERGFSLNERGRLLQAFFAQWNEPAGKP